MWESQRDNNDILGNYKGVERGNKTYADSERVEDNCEGDVCRRVQRGNVGKPPGDANPH